MKDSAIYSSHSHDTQVSLSSYYSPVGHLCIGASALGVRFIQLVDKDIPQENPNEITNTAKEQLIAYFEKKLLAFDVPLDITGYSEFSVKVWTQLQTITYGLTVSYMELSRQLGNIKAIRAVGTANGRNPIPIIIPCHRVIGSDGSLTGFALGLDVKKQLLSLENPDRFLTKQMVLF